MKTNKSASVWSFNLDCELDELPKKVVRVDDDIEVLVSDISQQDCHDSLSWNSSLELVRNTDPEWLNESCLVLTGSPTKRSNGALHKTFHFSKQKTKVTQERVKVPTPCKNSVIMVDNGMALPSSPNRSPRKLEVVLQRNETLENACSLKLDDLLMLKKEINSSSKLSLPEPFKIVKPHYPNEESSQCNGFLNGHKNISSSLPNCDNVNSSQKVTVFNLPQDTYFLQKEIKREFISDYDKTTSEFYSSPITVPSSLNRTNDSLFLSHHLKNEHILPDSDLENRCHSTSPSCSTNASVSSLSDEHSEKKKNFNGREIKQLFGSLNEIPWAQHWNPDMVLDEGRKPRQLKKRFSKPKALVTPSTSSKKKAVKILAAKSPNKNHQNTKNNTSDQFAFLNTRSSKKKTEASSTAKRKLNAKSSTKNEKPAQLKVKSLVKKKADDKKKFSAIRYDFINSKPNERADLKVKNVSVAQNKVLLAVNGSYKMNGGTKKANLPELKVKLEPVEAIDRHQKEAFDVLKIGENWSKSKINFDDIVSHHMDNIFQRNLTFCLNGKNSDNSDSESSKLKNKRKNDDDGMRFSIRHTEGAFRYKEIAVKKHPGFIQIILVPNNNKQNGLAIEALIELKDALVFASKDSSCKLVLLNSSGSVFCCGIDLTSLLGPDKLKAAERTANAIQDLVKVLALFSKPLIAAVNGAAVGFGVGILTFCDVVFASDKAIFYTPYAKLGHIPEAALTLTLPQAVGTIIVIYIKGILFEIQLFN